MTTNKKTITSWNGYVIEVLDRKLKAISPNGRKTSINIPHLSEVCVLGEAVVWEYSEGSNIYTPGQLKHKRRSSYSVPEMTNTDSYKLWYLSNNKKIELQKNKDYEVCNIWGRIKLLDIFEEQIYLNYSFSMQRIDLLAVNTQGEVKLFLGQEDKTVPKWPDIDAGWKGIARIYSRFSNDNILIYSISDELFSNINNHIYLPSNKNKLPSEEEVQIESNLYTQKISYKNFLDANQFDKSIINKIIASKREIKIVFFGDSITAGGDVIPLEHCFPNRLEAYLIKKYPDRGFKFINSGIGGTNSEQGVKRFNQDVAVYKPDIVTVMFILNDKDLEDEEVLSNHTFFIDEIRKIGGVPIFITPNLNTKVWLPGLNHAVERIRNLCIEKKVILSDTYKVWESLDELSIPYEALLINGINHPDNIAHEMFFNVLKEVFE